MSAGDEWARLPIDPDLAPDDPAQPAPGRPAHPPGRPRARVDVLAAIATGGALGASARYWVAHWLPTSTDGFPWATLWTNLAGSLLLGGVLVALAHDHGSARLLRPFLGAGLLGSFTTMSALQVEAALLIDHDRPLLATLYLSSSVGAGAGLAAVGMWLARRLVPTRSGTIR